MRGLKSFERNYDLRPFPLRRESKLGEIHINKGDRQQSGWVLFREAVARSLYNLPSPPDTVYKTDSPLVG